MARLGKFVLCTCVWPFLLNHRTPCAQSIGFTDKSARNSIINSGLSSSLPFSVCSFFVPSRSRWCGSDDRSWFYCSKYRKKNSSNPFGSTISYKRHKRLRTNKCWSEKKMSNGKPVFSTLRCPGSGPFMIHVFVINYRQTFYDDMQKCVPCDVLPIRCRFGIFSYFISWMPSSSTSSIKI